MTPPFLWHYAAGTEVSINNKGGKIIYNKMSKEATRKSLLVCDGPLLPLYPLRAWRADRQGGRGSEHF